MESLSTVKWVVSANDLVTNVSCGQKLSDRPNGREGIEARRVVWCELSIIFICLSVPNELLNYSCSGCSVAVVTAETICASRRFKYFLREGLLCQHDSGWQIKKNTKNTDARLTQDKKWQIKRTQMPLYSKINYIVQLTSASITQSHQAVKINQKNAGKYYLVINQLFTIHQLSPR